MRRTAVTVLCTSLLLTTSAFASGYGLREFSASSLGLSYAGAAANGERASTLAFNPALLGDVDTLDVSSSGIGLLPNTSGTFTATTAAGTPVSGNANPHGIVNTALVPSLSVRARLSDQFVVGLVVSSPWGMVTDYGTDWVGRYYATNSDVKTYNVTPMAAWQPVPQLSIGVGLQVQYMTGRLGKAIDFGTIAAGAPFSLPIGLGAGHTIPGAYDGSVLLKAHAWTLGYVLGVTWKPSPDIEVGVSYRSQLDNTLRGTETFTLGTMGTALNAGAKALLHTATGPFDDTAASAAFPNPAVITMGLKWRISDEFTALVGADWTGWSAFKTLTAVPTNPVGHDDVTTMDWKDSWSGSVGVEYRPLQDWVFRLGTAFDDTPTGNIYRTPGIPDGGRYWVSGGFGYKVNEHMGIDFSIARLFAEKAKINLYNRSGTSADENASRGTLTGVVNMGVTLVGVELSYRL